MTAPLFPRSLDDHAPWPAHPDDVLIDVTALGDLEPRYIRSVSHIGAQISAASMLYIEGSIPFEEFERRVDDVLKDIPW
jgi:hypothetical protein